MAERTFSIVDLLLMNHFFFIATDSDQDFDPTAEMLINDFDDEHTLDEEEALDDSGNADEIDDLNKEGEMPLEELLALYGYNQSNRPEKGDVTSSTNSTIAVTMGDSNSSSNSSLDQSVPNTSHCNSATSTVRSSQHFDEIPAQQTWSLGQCSSTNLLMGCMNNEISESDDDEDDEMSDTVDDWRRTIQVGSDYQASVPDGLCKYGDLPAYENEDKLIWDPTILSDKCVEEYLKQFQQLDALESVESSTGSNGSEDGTPFVPIPDTTLPFGCHIRDNEQALFLLLQCGHKIEEALRRRRMQPQLNIYEPMTSWSEEECRNFEDGLKTYGKDFHIIQKNKVRTRSVSEIVQFYYLWKKTERHDAFASKWRIEKKKYSLHPGTTDYMDRFLDEQENLALQAHSLSSSSYNLQPTTRQTVHASYSIMPSSSYHHLSSSGSALRPDSVMESLSVLENSGLCDGDRVSPVSMSPIVNGLKSENSVAQCCSTSGNNALKYRSPHSDDCYISASVTNGPNSSVHSLSSANNVRSSRQ
ncbi:mesoderm induction early response protein 1-like protein [Leptotrombidium deliense]|uniref:Mesoderm induction early response protein 1-like protein n=1 Tax=Leptotrombidium deliense TaxID=299467 RepID=A0A443SAG6_9ACAR|nr:mesoderm induction early response protein 1-like protein [Leptotrombidium deliense]